MAAEREAPVLTLAEPDTEGAAVSVLRGLDTDGDADAERLEDVETVMPALPMLRGEGDEGAEGDRGGDDHQPDRNSCDNEIFGPWEKEHDFSTGADEAD
jgi:hypothetical protein